MKMDLNVVMDVWNMQNSCHMIWGILLYSLKTIVSLCLSSNTTMKKETCILIGTNHTHSMLSSRFSIISTREEIRKSTRQCNRCCRSKAKPAEQLMGPLQPIRTKQHCMHSLVQMWIMEDRLLQNRDSENGETRDIYVCSHVWCQERSLRTSFLNTFYRMVSRIALPKEVISDSGTNFISGSNEL